jgi:hypothetical protein
MKLILLSAVLLNTALAAPLGADESATQSLPGLFSPTATPNVEQRFREADVRLAITQYEKLQTAAFEIELRLQLEPSTNEKERDELARKADTFRTQALRLREETIKRAAVLAAAAPH